MNTCKNGVRWLYKLDQDFSWHSGHSVSNKLSFKDKDGKVRLVIEKDGKITVSKGYAWDGCTPKFCFYDILIGTPDGVVHNRTEKPKTYYASLIHDAFYQFLPEMPEDKPVTRADADAFFLTLMTESEFAPRWIYWLAVRLFGGLAITTRKNITRKTSGSVEISDNVAKTK